MRIGAGAGACVVASPIWCDVTAESIPVVAASSDDVGATVVTSFFVETVVWSTAAMLTAVEISML